MKLKAVVAAVAMLAAAGGASAACDALTFTGNPATAAVAGSFANSGSSCHTFTLGPNSSISGGLFGFSFSSGSFLASLTGGTLASPFSLPTNGSIFSTLLGAGDYTLTVNFTSGGGFIPAGAYYGTVTAVPEPGTIALMLAGLGVVGFLAKRRGVIGGQPMAV